MCCVLVSAATHAHHHGGASHDPAWFAGTSKFDGRPQVDWPPTGGQPQLKPSIIAIPFGRPYTATHHHATPYSLKPTPYTLLPTPYPLHPTPCSLHPTPCTLHPAPSILHSSPCTRLHPAPCTLKPTPSTQLRASCTLHPTPYTLHPTPHTLHPASCILHRNPSQRDINLCCGAGADGGADEMANSNTDADTHNLPRVPKTVQIHNTDTNDELELQLDEL